MNTKYAVIDMYDGIGGTTIVSRHKTILAAEKEAARRNRIAGGAKYHGTPLDEHDLPTDPTPAQVDEYWSGILGRDENA